MKQIWMDKITRAKRLAVPVGVTALAVAGIAFGQSSPTSSNVTAVGEQADQTGTVSAESPAPTVTPTIMVNGELVPVNQNGSAEVSTGDGKATVTATSGRTVITTTQEPTSGDASSQKSGDVNINVNSNNTGGTSWSTVSTFGTRYSNDNLSTNVSNTMLFSSGNDNVSISQ